MTSIPTVSVVMPVHNGERFLAEAVDSILRQTYTDFEFVIVDDGSKDRSREILEDYQRHDARVIVHRHERNQGISAARNQACRMARGQLLAVMDADDISRPQRLERQVDYMRAHPDVAALGAWVQRIDAAGQLGRVHRYPAQPGLVAWSMLFFDPVAHPVMMFRRGSVDTTAVYSDQYPVAADYALLLRLSRTERVTNLPEVLLNYRTWQGNVSKHSNQAHHAMRVVQDAVAVLGPELSEDQVNALQGLSRDRYPTKVEEIRSVSDVIKTLRQIYLTRIARDRSDVRAINRDAATRLWLLGALATRRGALPLALSLAASAATTSPLSLGLFVAKGLTRLRST